MTIRLIVFTVFSLVGIWCLSSLSLQDPAYVAAFSVRASNHQPPPMNRCASCHQDVCDEFQNAPHTRTLIEASTPSILSRFAGRSFRIAENGPLISFEERDKQLWMTSETYPESLKIEWMFGSGQHAMTPVSLLTNSDGSTELIECSVSWFPPDLLGATPGADLSGSPGIRSLGETLDHARTMECFGCHVTHLPHDNGQIRQREIVTGVSCDRCHPGGEKHIASMEEGAALSIEKWSQLSPLESINQCGECHRRADQLTASELSPDRPVLVRFAPVGLAMSACFLKQDSVPGGPHSFRMDCMTCHDPHKPAEEAKEFYIAKCLQCHGPEKHQVAECTSPMTSGECLDCHMPTVGLTENLKLTDHWIRIRTSSDLPAAIDVAPDSKP
ncbi:MAG: multiheme c-type cytochrome [Planctomycetaceae bacterium]